MFKSCKQSRSHDLSCGVFTISAEKSGAGGVFRLFVLVGLLLGAGYLLMPPAISNELSLKSSLDGLKLENKKLADELAHQGMSLQHEQATREALERQLSVQAEELKKARKDLSFYRENTARQGQ